MGDDPYYPIAVHNELRHAIGSGRDFHLGRGRITSFIRSYPDSSMDIGSPLLPPACSEVESPSLPAPPNLHHLRLREREACQRVRILLRWRHSRCTIVIDRLRLRLRSCSPSVLPILWAGSISSMG